MNLIQTQSLSFDDIFLKISEYIYLFLLALNKKIIIWNAKTQNDT